MHKSSKLAPTLATLLLFSFLFPFANATTPGDPKGDYLPTMPLAATLPPNVTTCPADSTACPNTNNGTVCCPTATTCLKKQDIHGVAGWGCCTTVPMGVTCPLLLSNQKCAVEGWVVCGGVDGKLKSATCCEKVDMCRDIGRGKWDCAAGGGTEVHGNATQTPAQTTTAPITVETTGGAGMTSGRIEMLGLGVGMAAAAGLWII